MQAVRNERPQGPPQPPSVRPEYLRTRRSVTKEAKGLESVQQLAIGSEAGWRTPWMLPPISKRWPEKVSARLVLLFLGWLLEGSVRPSWAKGGLIVMDGTTRTLIGSIEDRDPDNQLVPGDWARLLRCSAKQARRCIHLAQRLGLVEQIRNRVPRLRGKCEQPAAYLPTLKLLEWLRDRKPAADLLDPSLQSDILSDHQKSSPTSDVSEDLLRPEGLHGVGHGGLAPEAERPAQAEPELVGTVAVASSAAPVGDERPAEGPQLLVAGVSARPAAPPAEKPPARLSPEETEEFTRELLGQMRLIPDLPPIPTDELAARKAMLRAKAAEVERARREDPPPTGGAA